LQSKTPTQVTQIGHVPDFVPSTMRGRREWKEEKKKMRAGSSDGVWANKSS
jgi:hypothetical protein